MPNFIDYTGQTIGQFTIIKFVGRDKYKSALWECQCSCGTIKIIRVSSLKSGAIKSCGCFKKSHLISISTNHNQGKHPLYSTYAQMIHRCTNPNSKNYHRYGGRGIKVCKEWLGNPEQFFKDMGPKPTPKHSIDRINNDGDYSPDNCRWATNKEQSNNQSTNHLITFNGETKNIQQWSEAFNLNQNTFHSRILHGWSIDRILSEPTQKRRKKLPLITYQGKEQSVCDWAKELLIDYGVLKSRIFYLGWDIEKALTTPVTKKNKKQ